MTKIAFIGGYGRSGSTLLDRVLGQTEGVVSAGEIRHIWKEGFIENRLCGCGARFHDCTFWNEVTQEAFGGMGALNVEEVLAHKARVDEFYYIPLLASRRRPARFQASLDRYGDVLQRLYAAIAGVSGAEVVVDSSKDVSHGWLLSTMRDRLDLHVVHLLRDSRAVAYSWQRKKFNPGSGQDMNRYNLLKTGLEWVAINALTSLLRKRVPRSSVLRYEDLVSEPEAHVGALVGRIGMGAAATPVRQGRSVELGTDHTAAGNPIRFQHGHIEIRADEEWRTAMPTRSQWIMTALTWPLLARHRFL